MKKDEKYLATRELPGNKADIDMVIKVGRGYTGPGALGGKRKGVNTMPKTSLVSFEILPPVSFSRKEETFFSVTWTTLETKL